MSALPRRTRRKPSLLQMAEQFGNVSQACRVMDFCRDSFYEIERGFPTVRSGRS